MDYLINKYKILTLTNEEWFPVHFEKDLDRCFTDENFDFTIFCNVLPIWSSLVFISMVVRDYFL